MTDGQTIELRLEQKKCIKCGVNPSIDWPYLCDECLEALAKAQAAKKPRAALES